jgi:hypothetical protein
MLDFIILIKVFVIMSSILLQFKRFFVAMNHILNHNGNEELQYKNVACIYIPIFLMVSNRIVSVMVSALTSSAACRSRVRAQIGSNLLRLLNWSLLLLR